MRRWVWLVITGMTALLVAGVLTATALASGPGAPGPAAGTPAATSAATTAPGAAPVPNGDDNALGELSMGRVSLRSLLAKGLNNQVTLQRIADALGTNVSDLKTQLQIGKTVAQIAQANNVDLSKVADATVAPVSDMLAVAVKYGYLTQAQSDAALAMAKTRVTQYFNAPHPGPGNLVQVTEQRIADALGITVADLEAGLQSGKTIAQMAQEHDADLSKVVDATLAPISDALAVSVKYGYLTQAQSDAMLAKAQTAVRKLFQMQHPERAIGKLLGNAAKDRRGGNGAGAKGNGWMGLNTLFQ